MKNGWVSRAPVVLMVLLAFTAVSCGRFSRRGAPIDIPVRTPVDYGDDLEFSPPPTQGRGKGRLTIIVAEEGTNLPIAGANVKYEGPEDGEMTTDADGEASTMVKSGAYKVTLPPCGRNVLITTYAEAIVGVVAGGVAGGPLLTSWEQRFRPTPSVQVSKRPPWKSGESITLGVRVEDGCDFSDAIGATMSFYAWSTSEHFSFLKQPSLTADREGFARVTVRCNRRGTGEIVIYNRFNPDSKVNLIEAISAPEGGRPFCE